MSQHLFIINGRSESGKDKFVEFLFEALGPYYERQNISSITPVYDTLIGLGIPMMPKTPETRQLAADLKKVLNGYNRWADKMAITAVSEAYANGSPQHHSITFLHVREPESISFIRNNAPFNWKVSTLWIERPDAPTVANDSRATDYDYDFVITNSGTLEDLKAQAVEFAQKFTN